MIDFHPKRNPSIRTKVLPDGFVVLFNEDVEWAHTLNPWGALTWEFCDGSHSVRDIVNEINVLVKVEDREVLSKQIEAFVRQLIDSGLLCLSSEEASSDTL